MTDKLNLILIQLDSLNRHALTCYGNSWIKTPNLTAFAERSAVFDNHFISSAPCMPARREIWTGSQEFWWRGWGPLEPWDRPLAYQTGQNSITSHLITDHYHFFEWGAHNYNYDFDGYDFIRGHENDNWRTDPLPQIPDWATKMVERRGPPTLTYVRNTLDFKDEADFFGPKVMHRVTDWLDRNHGLDQFYLHVDCFDVHEPFHIPEPYRSMYTTDDYRKYNPWPLYGRIDEGEAALSPEELEWVQAQYAGKLTMLDTWLGRVFDSLERHNLWERTCVIITTDHGHYLGDHGWMGKPIAPMYHTLSHIPLLIWHPAGVHNGQRVAATTQTVDLYATALQLLEAEIPEADFIHSQSFAPLLLGQCDVHRDYAVYGYANERVGLTTGEWTLLRDHDNNAATPYWYTHQIEQTDIIGWVRRKGNLPKFQGLEAGLFVEGVEMPVWRVPVPASTPRVLSHPKRPDLLFHNPSDPEQLEDVSAKHPEVIRRLESVLRNHMETLGVPPEQFQRLGLTI